MEYATIARQNFSVWNEALRSGDPRKVAALYADGVTFLPTVSGECKRGRAAAEGYFAHFLAKRPSGTVVQDEVQPLGPDCYVHSGRYDFEVGPAQSRSVVEARFTFVWCRNARGEWEILHHHSSARPGE
ncbi:MAG: SgcJ/EcaC family oxidoreductase [Parcubacteria group bacterium]|nr:SgcJ/EcaC family oxidoreductase [Parcubacteria group bacterium]